MSSDNPSFTPPERDRLRHELRAPLTVVTARGQHLQRQLLRADGLGNLERELMLGNLATMLGELQRLGDRIEAHIGSESSVPLPITPYDPPVDLS